MTYLRIIRQAFRLGISQFGGNWDWQSWVFGWLLGVFAQLAFFALLGKLVASEDRFHYLLVGNAVAAGCAQANVAVAVSTWDRGDGTYPLLVIAPSSLVPAIIGRTASYLIAGAATAVLALLAIRLFFGTPMPWPGALALPPIVILSCTSSFFLACFLGAFVARVPSTRNIVHRFATTAIILFCGVSVPVSFWPGWVEAVAHVLPVTHGLEAVRLVLAGSAAGPVLEQVCWEVVVGLGWLAIAGLVIDRLADAGRRDGSIEFI